MLEMSLGMACQYFRKGVLVRPFSVLHKVLSTLEHIWNVLVLMHATP